MKYTKVLGLMALTALAVTSCSKSDEPDPNITPSDSAIRFSVAVPRMPRTTPTLTETISTFNTWSFVGGKPYMNDVTVSKQGNTWVSNPLQYWPAEGDVNFYSISPRVSGNLTSRDKDGTTKDIKNYQSNGLTDLLYAVNIGEQRGGTVDVNFRHALSQLIFRVQRESGAGVPDIGVDVKQITLYNVNKQGSFTFPRQATSRDNFAPETIGEWNEISVADPIAVSSTQFDFADNDIYDAPNPQYVFAIPQPIGEVSKNGAAYKGPYVAVMCKISIAGNVVWPDKNVTSQTADRYAEIIFPLNSGADFRWEPGKAYRYTLTIGIPQTDDNLINFDVTVDEYGTFTDL